MNMSESPFATQSAAMTALLATVAVIAGELGKAGLLDPDRFDASLDELLESTGEPSEVATEMRKAIVQMMKRAVRDGTAL
ncbi:hypothetical protein [Variovorax ginsengisoli]|uniref:Uncharacterized protein n=1 Tax=Variovorax ginsengisoli TaxID=363844 RepID=A0ABT8SDK6_9BURK|nr:hypothetical protein [Variovorax ginsengisoli]MDN8617829.1 hypothetical protein [Variovorax ginsengisoli]MDO1536999.1 hypothetical protein [Variovorax ginsengisoli]